MVAGVCVCHFFISGFVSPSPGPGLVGSANRAIVCATKVVALIATRARSQVVRTPPSHRQLIGVLPYVHYSTVKFGPNTNATVFFNSMAYDMFTSRILRTSDTRLFYDQSTSCTLSIMFVPLAHITNSFRIACRITFCHANPSNIMCK